MTTFLIALDGASPNLINKWIDEGHLKNLGKIRSQGLSGKLESTFPPLTGPAWSSFHTGVNPGKHGVYTWLDLSDSYKGKVINGSSIKTKTIWKQISSQGGRVGLLSVPVTYPPEKVNGFVVPGFLTPSAAGNRSYPDDLLAELKGAVPDY
ncbi:MAG: alkaline phosphatase family protein, partial [Candidatus Bipolaricaulia bacterium]